MKHFFIIVFASCIFFSCENKVRKAGRIQIEVAVYHDPNGDLYNSELLQVSDLYFVGTRFLEHIPYYNDSLQIPRFTLINLDEGNTLAGEDLNELPKNKTYKDLSEKKYGAIFIPPPVPGYEKREVISDTIFSGYDYKRLRIVNDSSYSVFYIHKTDTVLPFSLAPQISKDYRGLLNRIDTYDKINDRFISLRMTVTDTVPLKIFNILNSENNDKRKN